MNFVTINFLDPTESRRNYTNVTNVNSEGNYLTITIFADNEEIEHNISNSRVEHYSVQPMREQ